MAKHVKKSEEDFPPGTFLRECQECGNFQADSAPDRSEELPRSYQDRKCKHCKSESLDYGSVRVLIEDYDYRDD